MAKNITTITIITAVLTLSGCSSLNATAEKLGVNFWSKKTLKAPCKVASLESDGVFCVGVPLQKPDDAELLTLRGLYSFDVAFSSDSHTQKNKDHVVGLAT